MSFICFVVWYFEFQLPIWSLLEFWWLPVFIRFKLNWVLSLFFFIEICCSCSRFIQCVPFFFLNRYLDGFSCRESWELMLLFFSFCIFVLLYELGALMML